MTVDMRLVLAFLVAATLLADPLRLEPGTHAFLCIQEAGLGLAGPLEVTP